MRLFRFVVITMFMRSVGKRGTTTLNMSNLKNNNNKYYKIQVLQQDTPPYKVVLWTHWGRVGYRGQHKIMNCS